MVRTLKAGEHYKGFARFGHNMPSTLAQLHYFNKEGICLDVLGMPDAEAIAAIFAKAGKVAHFQYTKSKQFVHLLTSGLWDIMIEQL